jgi:hypothetical protein
MAAITWANLMRQEGKASGSGGSEMSESCVAMSLIALWSMKRSRKVQESTMIPVRLKQVGRLFSDDSEAPDGMKMTSYLKPGDGKRGGWYGTIVILEP